MISAAAFIARCREYLGVPFRHQGRSMRGVDCVGLFVCAARDLGMIPSDSLNYLHDPDAETLYAYLEANRLAPVPAKEIELGDFLLIRWRAESPRHIALRTDIGLIHSYAQARRVVETAVPAGLQIVRGYRAPWLV